MPQFYNGQMAIGAHSFVGNVLSDLNNGSGVDTIKKILEGLTDEEILALMAGFNALLQQVEHLGDAVAALGLSRGLLHEGITPARCMEIFRTSKFNYRGNHGEEEGSIVGRAESA